jgi:hypothetical protein
MFHEQKYNDLIDVTDENRNPTRTRKMTLDFRNAIRNMINVGKTIINHSQMGG